MLYRRFLPDTKNSFLALSTCQTYRLRAASMVSSVKTTPTDASTRLAATTSGCSSRVLVRTRPTRPKSCLAVVWEGHVWRELSQTRQMRLKSKRVPGCFPTWSSAKGTRRLTTTSLLSDRTTTTAYSRSGRGMSALLVVVEVEELQSHV